MKLHAKFECDCKATTFFDYEKPTLGKMQTLTNLMCEGCHSRWVMRMRWHSDGDLSDFKLLRPSQKLADILNKKKIDAILNAPQKKSPIVIVPSMHGIKVVSQPIKKNF